MDYAARDLYTYICMHSVVHCYTYGQHYVHSNRILMLKYTCLFLLDINECDDTYHGCHHNCQNTIGSYNCTCYDGFILAEDERSCEGKLLNTNSS